jgi:hypothetical protein
MICSSGANLIGKFMYDARQNAHLFAHPLSTSIINVFWKNDLSLKMGVYMH